jgi:predicted CoA-binding protein
MKKDDVSADIKKVLTTYRTVAVVGASPKPERPSYRVADFLKKEGFHVIPVTPNADKVVEEKAYPDLASIPVPVEVVDIFRRPEDVPPVVDDAIAIGAKAVWMQEGIVNEEAAAKARKAGLTVVMDHCMRKELLKKLGREKEI